MSPKETAYIVERLAVRFMAMVAEYERKLLEHRDSFGARTSADARIIEGMRAELQEARRNACLPGESLNEAITRTDRELDTAREQRDSIQVERDALRAEVADLRGIVDMVHASLGIKQGDHIGNAIAALKLQSVTTPKRSHPVKDGEYVRRTKAACAHFGHVAKVLEFIEPCSYEVQCIEGRGIWVFHNCEPCDPPVDHDTPAGKASALVAHPVSRYADTEPELDQPTEVERAETELNRAQWADRYERKESADDGPKPGDVVRLVRVPTNDEYPHDSGRWEPNWGGIGDYMRVHYVGSNINGTRVVRAVFGLEWPLSCVEVVKGGDK